METFSLEKEAGDIHFGKTKEYFREVFSSYQNGNYRSAVVMLWSVVICDIVYKLQHLVDLYEDGEARSILKEMQRSQGDDNRSSSWEFSLVKNAYERTNLIDSAEYENLNYLHKQRNLSAHPVIRDDSELHSPNKETVRSLLRNTLEGVLVKPPFYTQKITGEILYDMAENKDTLNTKEKVKKYLESRYLKRLKPETEMSVFRSMWKLVFKTENDDCEKNRRINLKVLEVISDRQRLKVLEHVEKEQEYYSSIAASGNPVDHLVYFLAYNPGVYELLAEDAKIKIRGCVDSRRVGIAMGWFVKESLIRHYEDLKAWFEGPDKPAFETKGWEALFAIDDSEEWQEMFCKLVGSYYGASKRYAVANERFSEALEPNLGRFNKEALIFTLQRIEANDQTYGRSQALSDHLKIKERALELDEEFDFSPYPMFRSRLKEEEAETERDRAGKSDDGSDDRSLRELAE